MAIVLLAILTALLVLATVLPWVPWPHGIVRVCEFPRVQIAALAGILLIVTVLLGPGGAPELTLAGLQFAVMGVQAANCLRFTSLHPVQSLDHDGNADDPSVLRILSANIKMSNRRFGALVDLVRERRPDIAIVMEVNEAWMEALRPLKQEMPHTVEWPCDNTYGMTLLSRLPGGPARCAGIPLSRSRHGSVRAYWREAQKRRGDPPLCRASRAAGALRGYDWT